MTSLGAGTTSEKAFKGGGGAGDPSAGPGRASKTWAGGAEETRHSWKEDGPEQWGRGRRSETRWKRALKSPQFERREVKTSFIA